MKHYLGSVLLIASLANLAPALAGETLQFVERPLHEVTTHVSKSADGPGDLLTFANPVFDAGNQIQVASDQGFCIRVVPGKSWECFWTLLTKGGHITVEGPFLDQGDSHLTITGGTGKYAGAKGSMTLHPRDATPTGYDFKYELL
jgi:allene oxide cyclase